MPGFWSCRDSQEPANVGLRSQDAEPSVRRLDGRVEEHCRCWRGAVNASSIPKAGRIRGSRRSMSSSDVAQKRRSSHKSAIVAVPSRDRLRGARGTPIGCSAVRGNARARTAARRPFDEGTGILAIPSGRTIRAPPTSHESVRVAGELGSWGSFRAAESGCMIRENSARDNLSCLNRSPVQP